MMPTLAERARQMLTKLALEPEWEAKFEINSYGFRPGRSTHDAIEAIFCSISKKDKYVLDADIKGCFDHASLCPLEKRNVLNCPARSCLKLSSVAGSSGNKNRCVSGSLLTWIVPLCIRS